MPTASSLTASKCRPYEASSPKIARKAPLFHFYLPQSNYFFLKPPSSSLYHLISSSTNISAQKTPVDETPIKASIPVTLHAEISTTAKEITTASKATSNLENLPANAKSTFSKKKSKPKAKKKTAPPATKPSQTTTSQPAQEVVPDKSLIETREEMRERLKNDTDVEEFLADKEVTASALRDLCLKMERPALQEIRDACADLFCLEEVEDDDVPMSRTNEQDSKKAEVYDKRIFTPEPRKGALPDKWISRREEARAKHGPLPSLEKMFGEVGSSLLDFGEKDRDQFQNKKIRVKICGRNIWNYPSDKVVNRGGANWAEWGFIMYFESSSDDAMDMTARQQSGGRSSQYRRFHTVFEAQNFICVHIKRDDPVSRRLVQYLSMQSHEILVLLYRQKSGLGRASKNEWDIITSIGPKVFEEMDKHRDWHFSFKGYYDDEINKEGTQFFYGEATKEHHEEMKKQRESGVIDTDALPENVNFPRNLLYNDADELEDSNLFPEERPSEPMNPLEISRIEPIKRWEDEGFSMQRFIDGMDLLDPELTDDQGAESPVSDNGSEAWSDEKGELGDENDRDPNFRSQMDLMMKLLAKAAKKLPKPRVGNPGFSDPTRAQFMTFMDREKARTFELIDALDIGSELAKDLHKLITKINPFFSQEFLEFEKGARFKHSLLSNQEERAKNSPDVRTHISNKYRSQEFWADFVKEAGKMEHTGDLNALPAEWDLAIRPIIAHLFKSGVLRTHADTHHAGQAFANTEPHRPNLDLFIDYRIQIPTVQMPPSMLDSHSIPSFRSLSTAFASKNPNARFSTLTLWSSAYFYPLMIGPDNHDATSFRDLTSRNYI
ncbi:hypothetical protein G7Y89_g15309 [Cudoniella acicularis]|uniref:Uncharacterized protein n=1 Tax=Cudoniella acicularis TaxID=354080 RepID=A0A8H4VMZ3_9HELO|nr:hypothetical protein G7Y89_g15309 [Cudoniella acicularis]